MSIARRVSSSASAKSFWKNSFTVASPPTFGSSSLVSGFSSSRICEVIPSQFLRAGLGADGEGAGGSGVVLVEAKLARAGEGVGVREV